tara:strand:- start:201 stop:437 length:237 start_codon:yes stop_codon:yes gene_type:complete
MPVVNIDQDAVTSGHVATTDSDGSHIDVVGTIIPVIVPDSDRSDWLASYDPAEQYSPSAADSRIIARAVLDSLKKVNP